MLPAERAKQNSNRIPDGTVLWSRRCVMERRQFTREFKLEAVRLIKERGVSYAQASEDLGVHPTQLRNWVKQLAEDPQHAFLARVR
jgi:transposase-like protein